MRQKLSWAYRYTSFFFETLVTILGIIFLVTAALRFIPGDPVLFLLGEESDHAAQSVAESELREKLGLNQSLPEQFRSWCVRLVHLDLGESLIKQVPVKQLIAPRLLPTLLLGCLSVLLSNFTALGLNFFLMLTSRTQGPFARFMQYAALICEAVPVFWLAPLLVLAFSFHGPHLPVSGWQGSLSFILPLVTLSLGFTAFLFRTSYALLNDVLRCDFIRTAKSKGLSPLRVFFVHAAPHLFAPLAVISFQHLGHLFAGALITETLFDWPGLGSLLFESISSRDYPVIQAIVLFSSLGTVLLNQVGELLAAKFTPHLRRGI